MAAEVSSTRNLLRYLTSRKNWRVIRETERNRKDVLLQTDSGQVLGPYESAILLAETFYSDNRIDSNDPYHMKIKREDNSESGQG
ncbi:hypothetical protein EVAR_7094_1 [Eumeta japonica]|uniref:Uncharacterized protein n=1 Tax=Eumeta variegata TaxID=151549 RepID=A0A4C1YDK9_EUMVA|nr:hypothetical protein EVAR_7094_1 [Eumeta japonica]